MGKTPKSMVGRVGVLIGLLLFWGVGVAQAHFVEEAGTVTALLHIIPEEPKVGEPSVLEFQFLDTAQSFTGYSCTCTVSIAQDGREIYSRPLFQGGADAEALTAKSFFTFPEPGMYEIRLQGEPRQPDTFRAFAIAYTLPVGEPWPISWIRYVGSHIWHEGRFAPHGVHVVGAGLGVAVFSGLFLRERLRNAWGSRPGGLGTI